MNIGTSIKVGNNFAGVSSVKIANSDDYRFEKGMIVIWLGFFVSKTGILCQIVVVPDGCCVYIPGLEPSDIGTIL